MKSELEQVKGDVDAIKAELDAERANVHAVSTIYLNSYFAFLFLGVIVSQMIDLFTDQN